MSLHVYSTACFHPCSFAVLMQTWITSLAGRFRMRASKTFKQPGNPCQDHGFIDFAYHEETVESIIIDAMTAKVNSCIATVDVLSRTSADVAVSALSFQTRTVQKSILILELFVVSALQRLGAI